MPKATPLIKHDMRRATVVLETAAHDVGDEFLQYLYGMAALHLEEQSGKHQPNESVVSNDPRISMAAKMILAGRGDWPRKQD